MVSQQFHFIGAYAIISGFHPHMHMPCEHLSVKAPHLSVKLLTKQQFYSNQKQALSLIGFQLVTDQNPSPRILSKYKQAYKPTSQPVSEPRKTNSRTESCVFPGLDRPQS